MDDTQQSRTSEAAATRKRRSSILKSQRPPRTPFSELEFNVATPTDTTKSRRVSFSRRTGVAEFVTNEATTTWKNFYEEHNKSLESSGNESEANAARQPVGHIGKRIFDQQFEEVEAVDFIGSLNNPGMCVDTSHNINFSHQFESTGEENLQVPQSNFELSTFTDHQSKLFGDDLAIPTMGEVSDRIDINFSAVRPLDGKDDLDEIQKDLERAQSNVVCHGPFSGKDMSEYIEVDLNMTHVAMKNDQSDMSITDTIQSPKVQDVSKSFSIDKKSSIGKDWEIDKENIAVNPYVAPHESANFAINEEADKVLVFDGKRLTIESEKDDRKPKSRDNYRQTLLPDSLEQTTPQRKTIILNVHDDLPNFAEDMQCSKLDKVGSSSDKSKPSNILNDGDMSMTRPLTARLEDIQPKRRTMLFSDNTGDISMTAALPANIIISVKPESKEKRRTIVFENETGNLSITQALPQSVILPGQKDKSEKRRTIVYDNDMGDVSFTQAVPTNIFFTEHKQAILEQRKTLDHEKDYEVSMIQALPSNIIMSNRSEVGEKRKTILFENDTGNVSITQAIPTKIFEAKSDKQRTILFKDDTGDISITKAVPCNIILPERKSEDKRRTIVYETDSCNISITQTVPTNVLLLDGNDNNSADEGNLSFTQAIPNNILLPERPEVAKRTVVYKSDSGNISIIKSDTESNEDENKLLFKESDNIVLENDPIVISDGVIIGDGAKPDKRRTIVYQESTGDISITQSVPTNVLLHAPRDDIDYTDSENSMHDVRELQTNPREVVEDQDVSMTEVCNEKKPWNEEEFLEFDRQSEMSFIESLPPHIDHEEKLRTVYNLSANNVSMTKPIPSNLTAIINKDLNKEDTDKRTAVSTFELSGPVDQNVFVYQATAPHSVPKMQTKSDSKTGQSSVYNNVADTSTSQVKDTEPNAEEENNDRKPSDESLAYQNLEDNLLLNDPEIPEKPVEIKSEDSKEGCKAADERLMKAHELSIENKIPSSKEKSSILDELLDMSTTSLDCAMDDKNFMVKVESEQSTKETMDEENIEKPTVNVPSDDVFYITMDSDEEAQTDKETKVETEPIPSLPDEVYKPIESSTLAIDYKEDKQPRIVENLQKKLIKLKDKFSDKSKAKNRHYEQIKSSELDSDKETPVAPIEERLSMTKASESFKTANDTKELLEMLSDYTDKHTEEVDEKPPSSILVKDRILLESEEVKERSPSPILVKGRIALENKSEVVEPRRLSFAPSRQSIVISREDLLNNISMAQAALQRSRLDHSELEDTANDTTVDRYLSPQKKTVRLSDEVVKTLQFDEDDGSDVSIKSDNKASPLKKTAFGETSYMTDSKSKVIPSYLKDVSDGVKELMLELVKPMADVLPYENVTLDKDLGKSPSVCSNQVQANLITSSQIDVTNDLYSNPESVYDMHQVGSSSDNTLLGGMCRALKNPIKMFRTKDMKSSEEEPSSDTDGRCGRGLISAHDRSGPVIQFDHHNPLNNILLESMDYSVTHKYNPQPSTETLCGSDRSRSELNTSKEQEFEVQRVSTRYHVGGRSSSVEAKSLKTSEVSNTSKVVDQAVEAKLSETKDTEANTVIVMKPNKELLETSSSLTLVDDALMRSTYDVQINTQSNSLAEVQEEEQPPKKSPVKVIYKLNENGELKLYQQDTDVTSNDEDSRDLNKSRVKKRSHSPRRDKHKHCTVSSLDITPKPASKMQKVSSSQFTTAVNKLTAERDDTDNVGKSLTQQEASIDKARQLHEKRCRKSKQKKPGTSITVQQLITEYHIEGAMEAEAAHLLNEHQKSDTSSAEPNTRSHSDELERSVEVVSSFASSKQVRSASSETTGSSRATSDARIDWHPELINELSSKNLLECESGTNVVAKIDMLPFMGSPECEWESSSGDTWTFRLLHGRLRLTVKLAHRHDNGARTCVRADTPVLSLSVDPVHHDKKNSIAELCVSFACASMRALVGRGCSKAGEAPGLLRRAAAVARVALRWGRAMHDAKQHLAYTLTGDGLLALKVANIPLRSVWEVTMSIDLSGGEEGECPWPRAGDVRVARLVSDYKVPAAEVRRALRSVPADWGHVPRTVWRIFRHLKHKTRDDELLLGS